ncbi:zinc-binding dehydrogenase [Stachybotrys elegans]|uniref:Zinc-binding dehydrogenase n=1 Tax=Stachybotrys elegans TaxID=80388 RepID=A0A8K0WR80_9HYPO|nr:zinc-binding dehydrogenase [Stachybotrys elegans]
MASNYKFEGWLGLSPEAIEGKMEWKDFEPKKWQEDDVDIQITHCGVCGSDLHTLRSGWGETAYPCCVGHEIVGKAVRVGHNVKHVKVGDRVGVGAQGRSCLKPDCPDCSAGLENYCIREKINTYDSQYPNGEGKSYGGYADYNRTNGRFIFKIPDEIPSSMPRRCFAAASPCTRLCATMAAGLERLSASWALGADRVVGISRKAAKRDEVLALGADEYIATDDDKDWANKHRRTIDLIISTVSSDKMPLQGYLTLLKTYGALIQVGAPDGGNLPPVNAFSLIGGGIKVGGSGIGSPNEINEMLKLAVEKKIKPWVELRPMSDANQTVVDMVAGKPRYRYVLVNEKHLS